MSGYWWLHLKVDPVNLLFDEMAVAMIPLYLLPLLELLHLQHVKAIAKVAIHLLSLRVLLLLRVLLSLRALLPLLRVLNFHPVNLHLARVRKAKMAMARITIDLPSLLIFFPIDPAFLQPRTFGFCCSASSEQCGTQVQ